ncbi:MAG: heavy metal translocating P-type ATPase [Eggerthellales bacterium]|nr:heavy metal translocating P-type ATPase [Eggerthellales bacterium]
MNKKQRKWRNRILVALAIFIPVFLVTELLPLEEMLGSKQAAVLVEFALFLVPYLISGYDVLRKAVLGIIHRQPFDESLLMTIATLGAFALVVFPEGDPHMAEGAAVMLFYQVGELFQSYAVSKSRKSIADMMDIAPEFANVERDGQLEEIDPDEVAVGDIIVVKPGERVPLDGVVLEGTSSLDTRALTGESLPRKSAEGDEVTSGCVNLTGVLRVSVTKPYGESTVQRILELVENASDKKARTENFITRFARIYTPVVSVAALLLALVPPLMLGESWASWVERALIFLVVSCPCALVISVPLSFFGGIGGASRLGILIKGGNYLEALSQVDTVVFDKTGTLTTGTFQVVEVNPAEGITEEELLEAAAAVENYSDHPIAQSVRAAYGKPIDQTRLSQAEEISGHGVKTLVDGTPVAAGNDKLMTAEGVAFTPCTAVGTIIYVARNRQFLGSLVIADALKTDARQAINQLHSIGVKRCVMLTGDRAEVAHDIAGRLGLDDVRAQLLPQDKVEEFEQILAGQGDKSRTAFVGDGINDAPVLTRADVGIAMGALGSDAAIEAADVVLMDDAPSKIATSIRVARKTMGIARQNIAFALGVKLLVLILAAIGIANMWLAVFADVGVAVIAILNAIRCMSVK